MDPSPKWGIKNGDAISERLAATLSQQPFDDQIAMRREWCFANLGSATEDTGEAIAYRSGAAPNSFSDGKLWDEIDANHAADPDKHCKPEIRGPEGTRCASPVRGD